MSAIGDGEQTEDEREAQLEAAAVQQRARARRTFAWLLFAAIAAFALAAAQLAYRWSQSARPAAPVARPNAASPTLPPVPGAKD